MKKVKFIGLFSLALVCFVSTMLIATNRITPNDPHFSNQRHFQEIELEKAWIITDGENIIAAVLDTGVNFGRDLDPSKLVPGVDYTSANSPIIIYKEKDSVDLDGHGTHVASIIAQETNNQYGTAGVSPDTKIMPLKILKYRKGGKEVIEHIIKAIEYATNYKGGVDVINLSLEIESNESIQPKLEQAINNARQKNVVIVIAAGNKASQISSVSKIENEKVFVVGAYDKSDSKASYSNYGEAVDIYAPGGAITEELEGGCKPEALDSKFLSQSGIVATVTTKRKLVKNGKIITTGDKLLLCSGTSQAAPHVTGTVALIKSITKKTFKHPQIIEQIILKSADKESNLIKLNAGKAVQLAYKLINPDSDMLDDELTIIYESFSSNFLEKGVELVKKKLFLEALGVFEDAEKIKKGLSVDPEKHWNNLCFDATLYYGKKGEKENIRKIISACDKAVLLQEEASVKNKYYTSYYEALDSRAIAKALIGNLQGAVRDFNLIIKDKNKYNPFYELGYQKCIEARKEIEERYLPILKKGQNPFNPEELEKLPESCRN